MPISVYQSVIKHQGQRSIPPYLLDPMMIWGLMPKPSFRQKLAVCGLSNLKRILPEGDGQAIIRSLEQFSNNVENQGSHIFDLSKLAYKLSHLYKKSFVGSSKVDISFHASFEYSRSQGGKTEEFRKKVIFDFCNQSVTNIFPSCPTADVYDITGNIVIRPSDWDTDRNVADCLYLSCLPSDCVIGKTDSRLGLIALLWALTVLREEEDVEIDVEDELFDSFCSYRPGFRIQILGGSCRARVSPQPEEGFKVRTITITSLAVSFIGAVARHLLDHHMWSRPEIKIGLLSKVKLYTVLDHIGGKKSGDFSSNLFNPTPRVAESVDLSTATDTPPRRHVADILNGHLDGLKHPAERFLRFAVELATSKRTFTLDPHRRGRVPREHHCGIMMGEGLSGIFLNDCSAIVRSLSRPFAEHFGLIGRGFMSNDEAEHFILSNSDEIQWLFDNVPLAPNNNGSQSGDDVISFSNESLSSAYRIIYRSLGFVPSETTWFSSETYCTFTEEAALSTWDSNGWKFADNPKPRSFQTAGADPFGNVLPSKLKLLSSYMRYMDKKDPVFIRCINIADEMVHENRAWARVVKRHDIPVGLPTFLGGIDHPIGLTDSYDQTLTADDFKVIRGLSVMDPLEALDFIIETPEEAKGTVEEIVMKSVLSDIISKVRQLTVVETFIDNSESFIFDMREIIPSEGIPWWECSQRRTAFKKEHGLVSISEFINQISAQMTLKIMLIEGANVREPRRAWTQTKSRIIRLRDRFRSDPDLTSEEIKTLSIWKIRENVFNQADQLVAPIDTLDSLIDRKSLPSLSLRFKYENV